MGFRFWSILVVFALLFGCAKNRPSDAQTGSQTNWLKSCEGDSACGPFSCICGVCTESCTEDGECTRGDKNGICVNHRDPEVEICIAPTELPAICYPELDGLSANWEPRSSTAIRPNTGAYDGEPLNGRITLALTAGNALYVRLDNGEYDYSGGASQAQSPWIVDGAVFDQGEKFAYITSDNEYTLFEVKTLGWSAAEGITETASKFWFPLKDIIGQSDNSSYRFFDTNDGLVVLAESWPQYALWESRKTRESSPPELHLVVAVSEQPIYYAGISMGRFIFATEQKDDKKLLLLARGPEGWEELILDRAQAVGEIDIDYELYGVWAARHADRLALLFDSPSDKAPIPSWVDLPTQKRVGPTIEMSPFSKSVSQRVPFITAVISSDGSYGAALDADNFYLADLTEATYQSFDKSLGTIPRGKYLYSLAFRTNWQNGETEQWLQPDAFDTENVLFDLPREGSQIAIVQTPSNVGKKIESGPCSVYAVDIRDGERIQKLFYSDSGRWQGPVYLPDGNISIAVDEPEFDQTPLLFITPELDVQTHQVPVSIPRPIGDIFGSAPRIDPTE